MLSRVAKIEAGLTSLADDQHIMRGAFDAFASEMRGRLEGLSAEIATTQRTPWGTLASWAGVLIVVGAAVVGVVESQVQRNQYRLDALSAELSTRGEWMGRYGQQLDDARATQLRRSAVVAEVPVLAERIRLLEDARALSMEPLRQGLLRLEGAVGTIEARLDSMANSRFTKEDWIAEKSLLESRFRSLEAQGTKE